MKSTIIFIAFIAAFTIRTSGQQPGPGCEYRGTRPFRIYQQPVQENDKAEPSYQYSTNSVIPLQNKCFNWVITGNFGSCHVYDGYFYYEGYAGIMNGIECPIDDYVPFLMIGLSPVVFHLIRKKE